MTIVKVPASYRPVLVQACCKEFEGWFGYTQGLVRTSNSQNTLTPVTYCPFCGRRIERPDAA